MIIQIPTVARVTVTIRTQLQTALQLDNNIVERTDSNIGISYTHFKTKRLCAAYFQSATSPVSVLFVSPSCFMFDLSCVFRKSIVV